MNLSVGTDSTGALYAARFNEWRICGGEYYERAVHRFYVVLHLPNQVPGKVFHLDDVEVVPQGCAGDEGRRVIHVVFFHQLLAGVYVLFGKLGGFGYGHPYSKLGHECRGRLPAAVVIAARAGAPERLCVKRYNFHELSGDAALIRLRRRDPSANGRLTPTCPDPGRNTPKPGVCVRRASKPRSPMRRGYPVWGNLILPRIMRPRCLVQNLAIHEAGHAVRGPSSPKRRR